MMYKLKIILLIKMFLSKIFKISVEFYIFQNFYANMQVYVGPYMNSVSVYIHLFGSI